MYFHWQSTLAKSLFKELGGDENVTYLIHDSYYKGKKANGQGRSGTFPPRTGFSQESAVSLHNTDQTHKTLEERALTNFDHPDSLDTALLVQHIKDLKKGLSVEVPTYDFATHTRTKITVERIPRKIILVEGILIFAESELVKELDMKVFVVSEF